MFGAVKIGIIVVFFTIEILFFWFLIETLDKIVDAIVNPSKREICEPVVPDEWVS